MDFFHITIRLCGRSISYQWINTGIWYFVVVNLTRRGELRRDDVHTTTTLAHLNTPHLFGYMSDNNI